MAGIKRFITYMRLWLDPTKMAGYGITPVDVKNAITNENIDASARSAYTLLVLHTLKSELVFHADALQSCIHFP